MVRKQILVLGIGVFVSIACGDPEFSGDTDSHHGDAGDGGLDGSVSGEGDDTDAENGDDNGLPECGEVVVFPDGALEEAVREAIDVSEGDIERSALLELETFEAQDLGISDPTGVHCMTNLTSLDLDFNNIAEISAISPLKKLVELDLNNNLIDDISALSGLTNLEDVDLDNNSISDLSPLSGLEALSVIQLDYNEVSDLSPLVDSETIGEGDEVWVRGNAFDCEDQSTLDDIAALEERGVALYDPCNNTPIASANR